MGFIPLRRGISVKSIVLLTISLLLLGGCGNVAPSSDFTLSSSDGSALQFGTYKAQGGLPAASESYLEIKDDFSFDLHYFAEEGSGVVSGSFIISDPVPPNQIDVYFLKENDKACYIRFYSSDATSLPNPFYWLFAHDLDEPFPERNAFGKEFAYYETARRTAIAFIHNATLVDRNGKMAYQLGFGLPTFILS